MTMLSKIFVMLSMMFLIQFTAAYAAENQQMTPDQMRGWIKEALHYGFDMKTEDYTKYMSTAYVEHIDGKVFDFQQWLHHMNGLKGMMKSYSLTFDEIVVEGDRIATSYVVYATKKDGSKLDIRIIAIFTIKDNKMIFCDELTHLISGSETDKEIGARN